MKKGLVLVATIVAVIVIGNVIVAYAQNGTPPVQPNAGVCPNGFTCPYSGTMSFGGMMGGNHAQMHGAMMGANGMHQQVWTAVAEKLGLTYAELNTALQNGQTVAQLAQAKGISLDELKTVALDAMRTSFAELVKQGIMTQQQADWMLDRMDDMPMFNFDQGYGPGMMRGWQNGATPNGSYGRGMMGGRGGMMRGYAQPTGPQG